MTISKTQPIEANGCGISQAESMEALVCSEEWPSSSPNPKQKGLSVYTALRQARAPRLRPKQARYRFTRRPARGIKVGGRE